MALQKKLIRAAVMMTTTTTYRWHITISTIKLLHMIHAFHDFPYRSFPWILTKISTIFHQGNEHLRCSTVYTGPYVHSTN
jgi:hypothetical protein